MLWRRRVIVLLTGLCVVTSADAFSRPVHAGDQTHWRHQASESWVPTMRLERPNGDPNYVGWAQIPGAGCYGSYGCSRAQSGGHHSSQTRGGTWVYFGPQYTYVRGRGIVDEACNLPTSACPNTRRDGG